MDMCHLVQEVGNDPVLARRICHVFLANFSKDITELEQAIRKRESSEAFRIVHSFKYIIGLIGAKDALDAISSMEDQINSTKWNDVDNQLVQFSFMTREISDSMNSYLGRTRTISR
jgi:HPt (histidine-containing phosphotransfer) domain-containing protein